jgi:hypothetical protein
MLPPHHDLKLSNAPRVLPKNRPQTSVPRMVYLPYVSFTDNVPLQTHSDGGPASLPCHHGTLAANHSQVMTPSGQCHLFVPRKRDVRAQRNTLRSLPVLSKAATGMTVLSPSQNLSTIRSGSRGLHLCPHQIRNHRFTSREPLPELHPRKNSLTLLAQRCRQEACPDISRTDPRMKVSFNFGCDCCRIVSASLTTFCFLQPRVLHPCRLQHTSTDLFPHIGTHTPRQTCSMPLCVVKPPRARPRVKPRAKNRRLCIRGRRTAEA